MDDEPVLTADTPQFGYWGLGGFSGNNLWSNGSRDAPFDREVDNFFISRLALLHFDLKMVP